MLRSTRLVLETLKSPALKYATGRMVEMQALAMISVFVNFFRIQIEEAPGSFIFPSTLIILEAPSGSGKNAGCVFAEKFVFKKSFEAMETFWEVAVDKLMLEFIGEKKSRFLAEHPDDVAGAKKIVDKARVEFFKIKRRTSVMTPHDGSFNGFAMDRAWLERLKGGAPFVRVEEYGNKLMQMNKASYLELMFNRLVELVDNDVLTPVSVKANEDATPGSKGMGITNFFTLSNPTEGQKKSIMDAALQAVGRRGFLLRETLESLNYVEERGLYSLEELEEFEMEVKGLFDFLLDKFEANPVRFVLPLSDTARTYYDQEVRAKVADMYIVNSTSSLPSDHKNMRAVLMKDLDRKTLKVAGLLAVFNHGEVDFRILKTDIQEAERIVMDSYQCSKDFFTGSDATLPRKVLSFMEGKPWLSARELFDAGLFPRVPERGFQADVETIIFEACIPEAHKFGLHIEVRREKKSMKFKLYKMDESEERLRTSGIIADDEAYVPPALSIKS